MTNITEGKRSNLLKLMTMSSSPGILDNDYYNVKIEMEESADLHLCNQGYQRIFTMQNGAAQNINLVLHNNASLCYLPHPNVPHISSKYKSVNNIYLQANHSLCWSEIITCGRKLCDEKFLFTSYQNTTNVYIENKLVVKENVLLEPAKRNLSAIGQLEGYTHQSSLLLLNNDADINCLMAECRQLLLPIEGIQFGISALPVQGFSIRMLGNKAEQLFDLHKRLSHLFTKQPHAITL